MSYPMDLDDYTQDRLEAELARRKKLQGQGRCDYCAGNDPVKPCRYPDRHAMINVSGHVQLTGL